MPHPVFGSLVPPIATAAHINYRLPGFGSEILADTWRNGHEVPTTNQLPGRRRYDEPFEEDLQNRRSDDRRGPHRSTRRDVSDSEERDVRRRTGKQTGSGRRPRRDRPPRVFDASGYNEDDRGMVAGRQTDHSSGREAGEPPLPSIYLEQSRAVSDWQHQMYVSSQPGRSHIGPGYRVPEYDNDVDVFSGGVVGNVYGGRRPENPVGLGTAHGLGGLHPAAVNAVAYASGGVGSDGPWFPDESDLLTRSLGIQNVPSMNSVGIQYVLDGSGGLVPLNTFAPTKDNGNGYGVDGFASGYRSGVGGVVQSNVDPRTTSGVAGTSFGASRNFANVPGAQRPSNNNTLVFPSGSTSGGSGAVGQPVVITGTSCPLCGSTKYHCHDDYSLQGLTTNQPHPFGLRPMTLGQRGTAYDGSLPMTMGPSIGPPQTQVAAAESLNTELLSIATNSSGFVFQRAFLYTPYKTSDYPYV